MRNLPPTELRSNGASQQKLHQAASGQGGAQAVKAHQPLGEASGDDWGTTGELLGNPDFNDGTKESKYIMIYPEYWKTMENYWAYLILIII